MQSSSTTITELFDLIDQQAIVLTATNRLSRYLLSQYDASRHGKGWTAWKRPAILPLTTWIADQADHSAFAINVLTTAQELHLWETVIKEELDPLSNLSIRVPATALKASEAYRLLKQFNTSFSPDNAVKDHRAFHAWKILFEHALQRISYVSQSDLVLLIKDAIENGQIKAPRLIVIAGFDDLSPDLLQLFESLQSQGNHVLRWTPQPVPYSDITQWPCLNPELELQSCARWVRRLLENGAQNIGVIAPNLSFYQESLERIFRAELDPFSAVFPEDRPDVFNFSLGKALDNEGIIQAALRILNVPTRLHYEDISWLLRSSYLSGSQSEASARARADYQLRRTGIVSWPLDALIRYLKTQPGIKRFIGILRRLQMATCRSTAQTFGTWAETFLEFLKSCGWPGERSLSSRELQAVLHFKEALGQLAGLDPISGPAQRSTAVAKLGQYVAGVIFQVETEDSDIQIMGFLEASGLVFEHLWVLGMTDDQFPAAPDPSPFIPAQLQRQCGMPHANAEREKLFADQVFKRLVNTAPEIVFSYPQQIDSVLCRPSPYLSGIALTKPLMAPSVSPTYHQNKHRPIREWRIDAKVQPLMSPTTFTGGTAIIKDQALCPFRAFAHHRLQARGLKSPDLGIDPVLRGEFIHKVMELFWTQVKSRRNLIGLQEEKRHNLLSRCAEQTLNDYEKKNRVNIPPVLRQTEMERLIGLTEEWLNTEESRPDFTIHELETVHPVRVGSLTITTKIDRIDCLEDNRNAIIDYKTGLVNPTGWFGHRLTEPQLPIYCLNQEQQDVAAVLFAVIRPGSCRFRGVMSPGQSWPGLSERAQQRLFEEFAVEGFDDLYKHWRESISILGNEFSSGYVAVDPVDPDRTCRSCDLASFCRICEQSDALTTL